VETSDFRHFSGRPKQWQFPATADISYDESTDFKNFMCNFNPSSNEEIDAQKWFHLLRRMMNRTDLQIDLEKVFPVPKGDAPLGFFSTKRALEDAKRQKYEPWDAESDWTQAKDKDLS